MYPDGVFEKLNVSVVQARIGIPARLYPAGSAPQGAASPYATYQLITGVPANTLDTQPTHDTNRIQVTVWADDYAACIAAAKTIREEIEKTGEVISFSELGVDPDTNFYGVAIDWLMIEILSYSTSTSTD